jgi:ABC-type cobalamin/Fe3+-siderophores transport system ATPase subunit
VILLQDGGILADDAKEKVMTEANLRALFRTEIRLQRSDGFFHAY